jgi:hypothetical protein
VVSDQRDIFLTANTALTDAYARKTSGKAIYVDMMHNSIGYVMRSLYIARSLSVLTGSPIVALAGNPGVVTRSAFLSPDRLDVELARSFGVDDIIFVPETLDSDNESQQSAAPVFTLLETALEEQRVPPSTLKSLRRICNQDGVQIGRAIQDTYMRSNLLPTVYGGQKLYAVIEGVSRLDAWAKALFSQQPPFAFVSGHIDYSPWGLIMQRCMRAGGFGVYYRCDVRIPLYLLRRCKSGETLNGLLRRADAVAFSDYRRMRPLPANSADIRHTLDQGVAKNWRWAAHPDRVDGGQWPFDGSRPCVCLFTHTFTDQPSADESVFSDHLDWLEQTLEHAVGRGTYDLLVKVHPLDGYFDLAGSISRLAAKHADAANIFFQIEPIAKETLAERCVLGLTVRGTPGVEMSALGLPMLLAGRAYYDHLPSVSYAEDDHDYFSQIERAVRAGPAPKDVTIARDYAAFDRFWAAPNAPMVGPFNPHLDDSIQWTLAAAACSSTAFELDEVTAALQAAIASDSQVDAVRAFNAPATLRKSLTGGSAWKLQ